MVALRNAHSLLDASEGFDVGSVAQQMAATSVLRFFNSDMDYQPQDLSLLLRAVQINSCADRRQFFEDVSIHEYTAVKRERRRERKRGERRREERGGEKRLKCV